MLVNFVKVSLDLDVIMSLLKVNSQWALNKPTQIISNFTLDITHMIEDYPESTLHREAGFLCRLQRWPDGQIR